MQHDHQVHVHPVAQGEGTPVQGLLEVYVPRQECMFNQQDVIWTHVVSDMLIAASYFSIPFALLYFYKKRRDLAFNWIFLLFATFILACGVTHLFQIAAIWYPLYRLEGWVKGVTAVASVGTAAVLWPLIPKALALPSPAMLSQEITERTRAEEALRLSNDQLEERVKERTAELERLNRMKDDFLATLSHELRTPLSAILGWSNLLTRAAFDETKCREGLEVIERNARAQSRLISDLLDMQRIISGKMYVDARNTDLSEVLTSAVQVVRPSAEAKQITIETHFGENLRPVWGDPDRLQQVLWNLLANAVKFTPTGGRVRVEIASTGAKTQVRVSDNGAGIEPGVLPYIFDKFRQADQSITRREGGLGLGLAIVRHIAELHGGTVVAQSDGVGRGAVFTLELPVYALRAEPVRTRDAKADAAVASPGGTDLSGMKVLVVDDEADSGHMVERFLADQGGQVRTVTSVDAALPIFGDWHPDVVISDIAMPDRDGYDLIKEIRSRSNIPAIALTALARSEDIERAKKAGYNLHLAKPVEPEDLLMSVASFQRA